MRTSKKVMHGLFKAVLLTAILLAFSVPAPAVDDNPQVTQLLADAKQKAGVVSQDADQMEALTRTDATWHAHAAQLEVMKQHVNDLARAAEKLQAARTSASPWQQQAIDRMMPLLKELATNTNAAISHLSDLQSRPVSESYTQYLKANTDTAHELAQMISEYVDYGQAKARMERLEQKLEVATK
jgi:hypothetical protein